MYVWNTKCLIIFVRVACHLNATIDICHQRRRWCFNSLQLFWNPISNVTWEHNNSTITSSALRQPLTLNFNNILRSAAGDYTCKVFVNFKGTFNDSKTVRLVVECKYFHKFLIFFFKSRNVNKSKLLILHCIIFNVHFACTSIWDVCQS